MWKKKYSQAVLGRRCRHCQVDDNEASFKLVSCCDACARGRHRAGKCVRCGGPVRVVGKDRLCSTCDELKFRTKGMLKIVLISPIQTPERERVVWRGVKGFYRGKVGEAMLARIGVTKQQVRLALESMVEQTVYVEATREVWKAVRR
jgi:hypothetical protein